MLAASAEGAWLVRTPLLPLSVNGDAASSVYAVLEVTHSREIRLIAAQDAIADPPDRFPARRVR